MKGLVSSTLVWSSFSTPRDSSTDKQKLFELTPEAEKIKDNIKNEKLAKNDDNDNDSDSDEGWEEQPDYSDQIFKCLFSNNYFHTADQCLDSMKSVYNFDLEKFAINNKLNFYETVKLINFIRQKVLDGEKYDKGLKEIIEDKSNFQDIKYMFSTFEDDQLLYTFQSRYSQSLFEGEEEVRPQKNQNEDEEKGNSIEKNDDESNSDTTQSIENGIGEITIVDGVKIISEEVEDIAAIKARSILKDLITDTKDTVFQ